MDLLFNLFKRNTKHEDKSKTIQIKVCWSDDSLINKYKDKCFLLSDNVSFVNSFDKKTEYKYVYNPKNKPMDPNQFFQAVLSLIWRNIDYVVVSGTLDDYPLIGTSCIEDSIIYNVTTCKDLDTIQKGNQSLCGRLLRLPGVNDCETVIDINGLIKNARIEYESFIMTGDNSIPQSATPLITKKYNKTKKLIFVMPIFMAVGGVERNTIEVMRALKDKYDFCVITTERHSKAQGSLNYQLDGLCLFNIDLRELVEFSDYLQVLNVLKTIYEPDVVWLCNNSPWLEDNLLQFRDVFADQLIVAQDVYDTKYGWIEYYNTEGIHSLDRYIAVNEKIKDTFMDKYNIDESKIKVIYSLVNDKKIRDVLSAELDKYLLLDKYGLSSGKKHVALIGRMTSQKDPIRFLEIINNTINTIKDIEYVIVGDGELSGEVDSYIEKHNLGEHVKHIKFVDSTPELFQVLDGLVLTSVYEGLAIVSIEAMSIGVPVFSTDTGDLGLFISKTNGGLIIDDSKSDIDNFEQWYSNMNEYRINATKHAPEMLDFFSASSISKQYEELFDVNK